MLYTDFVFSKAHLIPVVCFCRQSIFLWWYSNAFLLVVCMVQLNYY